MADAPGPDSDRTLLDRLNALKPTTVNLDPSSKSVVGSTIEPAKPLSREDALSERLKSLRNQSGDKVFATSGSGANNEGGDTITSSSPNQTPQPQSGPQSSVIDPEVSDAAPTEESNDDADPLLFTDDQTLEELLADLESDQPWLDEVVAEEEEHRRVISLLDELGKSSKTDEDPDKDPDTKDSSHNDGDEDKSDDDSDGEQMTREADDILAQAMDEVDLEKANEPPPSQSEPGPTSPSHDVKPPTQGDQIDNPKPAQEIGETDPFNLPAVPSDLQDQPGVPDSSQDDKDDADFAASITSRMAALRVNVSTTRTLPSAPTSAVDDFGLPAAPTFAPADRPAPGLIKRYGFTDEDQKTWCVVCLEDGTIRCLDCDDDVYCARCWREMHVGPSAGYDERGHRWEKFVRGW
ncbi:uncharacterized protein F4822DRAFT_392007 [Hypoxylon trugodes]|uniref:uncharacterized protein n=1 Tax=Hypoxylon trugodes TaxID=326681 RepID=UPI002193AB88|nr:uncharacterized protein F4822DRAFT_392007 [Hypoxylon trugodes]KAI1392733.1 hypothetical protein F4822DRAFT_392007 [Hypoxylon trugodes]